MCRNIRNRTWQYYNTLQMVITQPRSQGFFSPLRTFMGHRTFTGNYLNLPLRDFYTTNSYAIKLGTDVPHHKWNKMTSLSFWWRHKVCHFGATIPVLLKLDSKLLFRISWAVIRFLAALVIFFTTYHTAFENFGWKPRKIVLRISEINPINQNRKNLGNLNLWRHKILSTITKISTPTKFEGIWTYKTKVIVILVFWASLPG